MSNCMSSVDYLEDLCMWPAGCACTLSYELPNLSLKIYVGGDTPASVCTVYTVYIRICLMARDIAWSAHVTMRKLLTRIVMWTCFVVSTCESVVNYANVNLNKYMSVNDYNVLLFGVPECCKYLL